MVSTSLMSGTLVMPTRAWSHERGGHELERGVLGALDADLT